MPRGLAFESGRDSVADSFAFVFVLERRRDDVIRPAALHTRQRCSAVQCSAVQQCTQSTHIRAAEKAAVY